MPLPLAGGFPFITLHTAALLSPLSLFHVALPNPNLLKPQKQSEVTKGHAVWPRTTLRAKAF